MTVVHAAKQLVVDINIKLTCMPLILSPELELKAKISLSLGLHSDSSNNAHPLHHGRIHPLVSPLALVIISFHMMISLWLSVLQGSPYPQSLSLQSL